jgi:hypothetical protein
MQCRVYPVFSLLDTNPLSIVTEEELGSLRYGEVWSDVSIDAFEDHVIRRSGVSYRQSYITPKVILIATVDRWRQDWCMPWW